MTGMATREIKVKKRARRRKDIPLDVVKEDKMPVGLLYAMGTRECTVVKEVDVDERLAG